MSVGIIVLVVVALAVVFLGVVIGAGCAAVVSNRNSHGRVDWGKVLGTMLTVPLVLGGVLVAFYVSARHQAEAVRAQAVVVKEHHVTHTRQAQQEEMHRRLDEHAQEYAEEHQVKYPSEIDASDFEVIDRGDGVTEIQMRGVESASDGGTSVEATAIVDGEEQATTPIASATSESHLDRTLQHAPDIELRSSMSWIALLVIAVAIGGIGILAKRFPRAVVAIGGGLCVAALFLVPAVTVTSRQATGPEYQEYQMSKSESNKSLASPELNLFAESDSDREIDAEKPIRIVEKVFGQNGKMEVVQVDEMPEWTQGQLGLGGRINEATGEIVLRSKRYSTGQEAEEELWPHAEDAVFELLKDTENEFIEMPIDRSMIGPLHLFDRQVQVSWPLEIGSFEEEVQQVYWRLRLDVEDRKQLVAISRERVSNKRLAYLAAGLGGITLLLGTGSVIARKREEKQVA